MVTRLDEESCVWTAQKPSWCGEWMSSCRACSRGQGPTCVKPCVPPWRVREREAPTESIWLGAGGIDAAASGRSYLGFAGLVVKLVEVDPVHNVLVRSRDLPRAGGVCGGSRSGHQRGRARPSQGRAARSGASLVLRDALAPPSSPLHVRARARAAPAPRHAYGGPVSSWPSPAPTTWWSYTRGGQSSGARPRARQRRARRRTQGSPRAASS